MVFSGLKKAAKAVAVVATDTTGTLLTYAVPDSVVQAFSDRFDPTPVPVVCRPKVTGVDNYEVEIDMSAFEQKLLSGRVPQPQFLIAAAYENLNRPLLAVRLQEQFDHDLRIVQERVRKSRIDDDASFLGSMKHLLAHPTSPEIGKEVVMMVLLGNPLVSLALATTGLSQGVESVVERSVKLLLLSIQQELFGLNPEQLEAQAAETKGDFEAAIAEIEIKIDPTLAY